jgi:TolB protein
MSLVRRTLGSLAIWGTAVLVGLWAGSASPRSPTVRWVTHDEGRLRRITTDGREKQRPAWSPDGSVLTFARHEAEGTFGGSIFQYLLENDTPERIRRLTTRELPEYHAVFSPDGSRLLLVVVSQSGTQGNLDIALVERDGAQLKVVAGDVGGKLSHQDWPSWTPDGRFAYSSTHEGNQEIYLSDLEGKAMTRLTQNPGHDAHPCVSPDGTRIVFSTDRWGGLELASVAPDGTGLTRLTTSPGLDDFPAVSPDGRRLAFVSNRDGNFEIYLCKIDGSEPTNLTQNPARDTEPCWTPDGSGITFLSNRLGGVDVYTLPAPP